MSVHSGNFPRVTDDLSGPTAWLGARGPVLLALASRPLASAAARLDAWRRRRAARRVALAEDLRIDWWRSQ